MLSPRADDDDDDEQDEDYNDYDNEEKEEEQEKEQIISMLKPIHTLTNQSINQLTHTHTSLSRKVINNNRNCSILFGCPECYWVARSVCRLSGRERESTHT